MARKAMTPATVGVDDQGQEGVTTNQYNTKAWCFRQLVKFALPWIAAAVTAFCSPSGKAGRSLDRLLIFVEGGADEI